MNEDAERNAEPPIRPTTLFRVEFNRGQVAGRAEGASLVFDPDKLRREDPTAALALTLVVQPIGPWAWRGTTQSWPGIRGRLRSASRLGFEPIVEAPTVNALVGLAARVLAERHRQGGGA